MTGLYMLEMAGFQVFGKMLKTSILPRRHFYSCFIKQNKMKRSADLLVSRTYSALAVRRMSSFAKTKLPWLQYERNVGASSLVLIKYNGHSVRCFSLDISADKVKEDTDYVSDNNFEDKTDYSKASVDIEVLLDELIDRSLKRDRMIAVIPKSDLHRHVTTLVEAGLQESDILNLHKYPELIKNLAPLADVVTLILEYGIPKQNISSFINDCPEVVQKSKTEILSRIEKLYGLGFTSDSMIKMICNYPALLVKDLSLVPNRIEDLKTWFKTKDTFKFIERSPELLFCDYDHILQRFNYVFWVMGITQPQMRYSKLFSYSLEHIHARHLFVERAGFFKKFARKKGQIDGNPTLDTIIDTSDEEFVKKFGNMTVKDFHTFKKLLKKDRVMTELEEEFLED